MENKDIEKLVSLRQKLINRFKKLKDYKNNKNAIMKEIEHAEFLHDTINALDKVLINHVNFSDKK